MTYSFAPSNQPLYVSEGDYVQFKFKAPSTWDTTLTVTVQIGELTQFWYIITVPEDFTPDPFPFQNVTDAELDTLYTYADGNRPAEAIVTVSGLTPTTQAGVSLTTNLAIPSGATDTDYYAMRLDYNGDGTWDTGWITSNTTVENGAKIQVRVRTQDFANQSSKVTLRIGTSFETWSVTTRPVPVNEPIPFPQFTDLSDQPLNTYIYSEVLPITGLLAPGAIDTNGGGEWAISTNSNTSTDDNGFEVLDGVTWSSDPGTVGNGSYLQLRVLSSNNGLTSIVTSLTIAEGPGSNWTVTTGNVPSTTPIVFSFPPVTNIATDTLVASAAKPDIGISGLGTGVTVPVTLVSTDSSEVKIKINNNSIGVFPATVTNGDRITLYLRTASTTLTVSQLTIKVGNLEISPWQVETYSGPDGDPDTIVSPPNKTNQIPGTYITSAPVTLTGINIPVTISSSNPFSLISIDYDTPAAGPRTFDPAINTSFRIVLLSATNLNTTESTTVTVGSGGTPNNPFVWSVTTYAVVPPGAANLGVWYSKKTEKFDGYPIGTVLPILKEGINNYGVLTGDLGSRYAGFIACEGQSVSAAQYWALWEVIGNHYGGNASYNDTTKTYSGNFNLPDYRNRKLCGTGIVDSARGNSAFVPISSAGKGITDPGAEGGYWYFDKVDPFGPEPLEQIQGTGDNGLNSQFYSLGTVRIRGLETLTESITFTITGSVSGVIGPLQEVIVTPPEHDHRYFAAVLDSNDGFPLIAWGNVDNGRGMFRTRAGSQNTDGTFSDGNNLVAASIDPDQNDNNVENIRNAWATDILAENGEAFVGGIFDFEQALQAYYGDSWNGTRAWVDQYFGTAVTGGNNNDTYISSYSEQPIALMAPLEFYTWWISSTSGITGTMQGNSSGAWAAVMDLRPTTFTVDSFIPESGTTRGHSHLLTLDPVQNIQSDYSQGNSGGSGSIGSGLGNGADSVSVVFNQSELFMDMTEGTFTYSRSFAIPIPDVTMKPQSQAPIINPFHKAKYIIKAY